jgi:hypothetical protein
MSTTARDCVYSALRKLGVSDPEETPSAPQAQYALEALNEMVHGWKAVNIDVGHVDWTLDSDVELEIDPRHIGGMKAMLAVYLSPEYPGSPVPPATIGLAEAGWRALQAAYVDASMDNTLQIDSALRRRGLFDIQTGR